MPSPFPGMNPYLETPELWSEVHSRLIVAIADMIAAPLRPNYYVAIEKRTYLSERSTPQKAEATATVTATLSSPQKPLTVTVPLVEEVRESYLEI